MHGKQHAQLARLACDMWAGALQEPPDQQARRQARLAAQRQELCSAQIPACSLSRHAFCSCLLQLPLDLAANPPCQQARQSSAQPGALYDALLDQLPVYAAQHAIGQPAESVMPSASQPGLAAVF